jgi:hypothetical protein
MRKNIKNKYIISTNNIAIGMVRNGGKIRFRSPKVRFPLTSPKRFLVSPKHSFVIDQFRRPSPSSGSLSRPSPVLSWLSETPPP